MDFDNSDKIILNRFLDDISQSTINGLSTMDDLWGLTNPTTKILIKNILALNPEVYGFRGKLILIEQVPTDTVKIVSTLTDTSGEYGLDGNKYLPKEVYSAFQKMAEAFNDESPNRRLLIGSGYRSPAFQLVTLIYILAKVYSFDLNKTLKRVAMPSYSQHCSVSNTAIDILNLDGEPTDQEPEQFSNSVEYRWLTKNANKYNFHEPYPANNTDGIMWEPWHWQYIR